MIKNIFLLAAVVMPSLILGQSYLEIESQSETAEIQSLIYSSPSSAEASGFVMNVGSERVDVSFTTENVFVPNGWIIDEFMLQNQDGNYSLEPNESFDFSFYTDIFLSDLNTINEKATHEIRVIATLEDGTEVHNEVITICYEFELADIPQPTFRILETYEDSIPTDTIYIPLASNPSS